MHVGTLPAASLPCCFLWITFNGINSPLFILIIPARVVTLIETVLSLCFGKASASSLLCLFSNDADVLRIAKGGGGGKPTKKKNPELFLFSDGYTQLKNPLSPSNLCWLSYWGLSGWGTTCLPRLCVLPLGSVSANIVTQLQRHRSSLTALQAALVCDEPANVNIRLSEIIRPLLCTVALASLLFEGFPPSSQCVVPFPLPLEIIDLSWLSSASVCHGKLLLPQGIDLKECSSFSLLFFLHSFSRFARCSCSPMLLTWWLFPPSFCMFIICYLQPISSRT